uniref:Peroxidase n=1 Tax=Leptobrachium leishanense TaxID=445787 RepID=A0A8C5LS64_9ANUR
MSFLQLVFVGLLMIHDGKLNKPNCGRTPNYPGEPPYYPGGQTPANNGNPPAIDNSVIRQCVNEAKTIVNYAYKKTRENLKRCLKDKAVTMRDVMNYANQAKGKTRDAARAADCLEVSLQLLGKKIRPVQQVSANITDLLKKEQWDLISELTGCKPVLIPKDCKKSPFRTITGMCNNRRNPSFGAANRAFRRVMPASYEDGKSVPVGWTRGKRVNGYLLPGARDISNHICKIIKNNIVLDKKWTLMFMQFGQQIDHDLTQSVSSPTQSPFLVDSVNCQTSCLQKDPCFPIPIPKDDSQFKNQSDCLPVTRTAAACNLECDTRQQINGLTSYIDGSFIYGSDPQTALMLRNMTSNLGLLNVNPHFRDGNLPYLPFNPAAEDACSTKKGTDTFKCFKAGDSRASEQPGITCTQTLFLREHNRVATELHKLNPSWSGDILYEVTRKIVAACFQHIVYDHWLPILLGPKMHEVIPPNNCYDECTDATVSNSFTIGFRVMHTLIRDYIYRYDSNYKPLPPQPIHKTFFSPGEILRKGGCDPLIRGLIFTPAKEKLADQLMTSNLREHLFENVGRIPNDLCGLNVQRSRDHGLPDYCTWRRHYNLSVPTNVYELGKLMDNEEVAQKFVKLYKSINNIDLWPAAVSEKAVPGGVVGETLFHIIGDQFKHTKFGDSHFYTNCGEFTPAQLSSIKGIRLSSIICENSHIKEVPKDPFLVTNREHLKKCSQIPKLNLLPWKGYDPYSHGESDRCKKSNRCGKSDGCGESNCCGKSNYCGK